MSYEYSEKYPNQYSRLSFGSDNRNVNALPLISQAGGFFPDHPLGYHVYLEAVARGTKRGFVMENDSRELYLTPLNGGSSGYTHVIMSYNEDKKRVFVLPKNSGNIMCLTTEAKVSVSGCSEEYYLLK